MQISLSNALTQWRPVSGGGGGGGAPAWLDYIKVKGDMMVDNTIAGPASVRQYTDGWVLEVGKTSSWTTVDPTKCTLYVWEYGWAPDGSQASRYRLINGTARFEKSYPDEGSYTDEDVGPNVVQFGLDQQIYNGTRTDDTLRDYKTNIVSISFAEGFFDGTSEAGVFTGEPTREDSKEWPLQIMKHLEWPYQVVGPAGTLSIGWVGGHEWAEQGQQLACVEAWMRAGGVDGTLARASTMTECVFSGAAAASGYYASEFRTVMSATGLSDGVGSVRACFKPWRGPKVNSFDTGIGEDWSVQSYSLLADFPIEIDVEGNKYSPLYAWVNQDGTGLLGTDLSGISTGTTDPGAATSYQNIRQAIIALTSANNSTSYRASGKTHNDCDAGVVMLRNVVGSTFGQNANSYSTRDVSITGTCNKVPVTIRSPGGTVTDEVRFRGVTDAGASITNKSMGISKAIWQGVKFDATNTSGTTSDGACLVWGSANTTPPATSTPSNIGFQVFVNCYAESHSSSATFKALNQTQVQYWYSSTVKNNATGIRSTGMSSHAGQVCVVGCDLLNTPMDAICAVATRTIGAGLITGQTNAAPAILAVKQWIVHNCRSDYTGGGPAGAFGPSEYGRQHLVHGFIVDGWIGQRVDGLSQAMLWIGGDTTPAMSFTNVVLQAISGAGGQTNTDGNAHRINWLYNDIGMGPTVREFSVRGLTLACHSFKDAYFSGTGAMSGAAWSNLTKYYMGQAVGDGGTIASGATAYWCLRDDTPIGTPLSDTTYWLNCGTPGATAVGAEPGRTGARRARMGVNCWGNCSAADPSGGNRATGVATLVSDIPWPGSGVNGLGQTKWGYLDFTTRFVDDVAGDSNGANAGLGDYRPDPAGELIDMLVPDADNPFSQPASPLDMLGVVRSLTLPRPCGALEAA